ncbi:hypothetical protein RHGRI_032192 [Rhododendron griersonianum]|uniref:Disease resistance protein At4g27190-like leucine-rich repeats domain-containing protein n=1 Tax=Rhododendron griersonianum TaxID=479676 RepID=A0AAV6IDA0_9ERIC|nr:hypothetical protein RHGRI_032192 [Rhododendron griersonianum]
MSEASTSLSSTLVPKGRNSPILKVLAQAVAFELVIGNNEIKQLSDSELTNMNGIQSCLIEGCDAIEAIVGTSNSVVFPHGSIQQLCEIQCLGIEKCDEIKEIISESDTRGNLPVLPKLKKMFLQDMRNLSSICAIETLEWPSLEELEIFNCPRLSKFPFSEENAKKLKRMDVDIAWQDWWESA